MVRIIIDNDHVFKIFFGKAAFNPTEVTEFARDQACIKFLHMRDSHNCQGIQDAMFAKQWHKEVADQFIMEVRVKTAAFCITLDIAGLKIITVTGAVIINRNFSF